MDNRKNKPVRVAFQISNETKLLLDKLAKIYDRPMTGVFEQLLKKEAKEHGLI
ncbi:MAG: hypothetical protein WC790_02945 [Candidatus Paceibacterota bacterium]|jgi:hypothetical protein